MAEKKEEIKKWFLDPSFADDCLFSRIVDYAIPLLR